MAINFDVYHSGGEAALESGVAANTGTEDNVEVAC